MTTGNLLDVKDHCLLDNCTLEEAINWLKDFNRHRGWRGGYTAWCPHGDLPVVELTDDDSNLLAT